jgi:hypothetical protein
MKKMLAGGMCLIAIFCGCKIFAYGQDFTHPHLARETGKFYSYFFPDNKLMIEEMEWLARGAKEEDTPPRYVNHFYNPLTNESWLGLDPLALTARNWANNRDVQKIAVGGDQTFEEAIYLYRDGNKRDAFVALGHVLHLIEDMSVPEHTRNDTHVSNPGTESPYEDWAEKYNQSNKDEISKDLIASGKKLSSCFSLENCFDEVAYYSNGYFFSIDSVEKFANPKIIRWENAQSETGDSVTYGYGKDENGVEFKLISKGAPQWRNYETTIPYGLDANILSDYYVRLSRKSVVAGAKVIQLFFDEIKYRETNNIPNVRPLSFLDKVSNTIKSWFWFLPSAPSKTVAMSGQPEQPGEEPVENNPAPQEEEQPELPPAALQNTPVPRQENNIPEPPAEESAPAGEIYFAPETPAEENHPAETPAPTPLQQAIATYGAGFGGFYAPESPAVSPETPSEESLDIPLSAPVESAPEITPEPEKSATTTEEIILPEIMAEETATSTEILPEEDNGGEENEETNATSTKITGEHIVISEIKIAGAEGGKKTDEFVELYNPTDSDVLLSGWKLRPFSKNGNEKSYLLRPFLESAIIQSKKYYLIAHEDYAEEVTVDSLYSTKESLADDNGLILYNAEEIIIDIVGWGDLKSADIYETEPALGIPDGSSLERKANASSTAESMTSGGTDEFLGNGYDSDNNLNDFILRDISDPQNSSSEKEPRDIVVEPEEDIEEVVEEEPVDEPEPEPEVWLGPTPLAGKVSNTVLTLTSEYNPYIINADFVIEKTAKLVIGPGVIIKFGKPFQSTWMKFPTTFHIAGSLEINGTEEKPVIFTSISDDSFAGDTNSDGSATGPAMDDWGAVFIESEADQTIDISHAKFFYGGASQATNGAVFVSRGGVIVNLSDCYFANNRTAIGGFGWKNTLSQPINITRTLIENNRSGIIMDVYAPVAIQRSTIRNNAEYGIYLEAYAPEVFFMEESNIYGNGYYGLWNFDGSRLTGNMQLADITAQNNWWGDADGPKPSWKTNKVKDKIDYSNWLTEEYNWQVAR